MRKLLTDISSRVSKPLFGFSAFTLVVAVFAFLKLITHILTAQGYGYFVDEFYAIDMSKHLDLNFIDVPPVAPLLVAISRLLFGESLFAYHMFPALAGAATLVFVCLITREMGGRLFATALSALGFIVAPMWLFVNSYFSYECINHLSLAIFLYFLVRYISTGNKKLWIRIGLMAGIAFMSKATILISGPGFLVALLATKHRKDLLTPWPWIAAGVFALVISPWVIWEFIHHWPTIEYWSVHAKMFIKISIPQYFINIALTMNPMLIPLFAAGLYRIFRRFKDTSYIFFGILFLVTAIVVYVLHTRVFELAHLFLPLLAAGAVFVEETLARVKLLELRRAVGVVGCCCLLGSGVLEAPLWLPILPLDSLVSYSHTFAFLFKPVKDYNYDTTSPIPLYLSQRLGWEEMVQKVAEVYNRLPEEDRNEAVIYGSMFSTAGALNLYGPKYGLPTATSGHLNYFLWGPGDKSWDVVVAAIAGNYPRGYAEYEMKDYSAIPYQVSFNRAEIWVFRKRQQGQTKEIIWDRLKYYW